MKIISWNLLRTIGASLADVVGLVERQQPGLLLMQEATREFDALPARLGGHYWRAPLPGRIHGLGIWSPGPAVRPPEVIRLPAGAVVHRVCQILHLPEFSIANVHLSHGQMLNRRQLARIAGALPGHAAVLGDFNLVGPTLMRGFRDVGPRAKTHRSLDLVPLRLDRCMVRGLVCLDAQALHRQASDHRPIMVEIERMAGEVAPGRARRLFFDRSDRPAAR